MDSPEGPWISESEECTEAFQILQLRSDSNNGSASSDGFIRTSILAYMINQSLVWFATLTLLSPYANGHASDLRGRFSGRTDIPLTRVPQECYPIHWSGVRLQISRVRVSSSGALYEQLRASLHLVLN